MPDPDATQIGYIKICIPQLALPEMARRWHTSSDNFTAFPSLRPPTKKVHTFVSCSPRSCRSSRCSLERTRLKNRKKLRKLPSSLAEFGLPPWHQGARYYFFWPVQRAEEPPPSTACSHWIPRQNDTHLEGQEVIICEIHGKLHYISPN